MNQTNNNNDNDDDNNNNNNYTRAGQLPNPRKRNRETG